MNPALVASIIQNVFIPELVRWIRSKIDKGDPMPTDDEVKAHLNDHANAMIATGEAWLGAHPASLDPPA